MYHPTDRIAHTMACYTGTGNSSVCYKCTNKGWVSKYGRKEMFYLTTHSTHFIYGYMAESEILSK